MLAFFMSLLGIAPAAFHTFDGITAAISDTKIAQIKATTDEEKTRLDTRMQILQARAQVLIAEAPTTAGIWNARMRILVALGPTSIILKLSFWDKVIGSLVGCSGKTPEGTCGAFITDPIDAHIWAAVAAVTGFYLLADAYLNKK